MYLVIAQVKFSSHGFLFFLLICLIMNSIYRFTFIHLMFSVLFVSFNWKQPTFKWRALIFFLTLCWVLQSPCIICIVTLLHALVCLHSKGVDNKVFIRVRQQHSPVTVIYVSGIWCLVLCPLVTFRCCVPSRDVSLCVRSWGLVVCPLVTSHCVPARVTSRCVAARDVSLCARSWRLIVCPLVTSRCVPARDVSLMCAEGRRVELCGWDAPWQRRRPSQTAGRDLEPRKQPQEEAGRQGRWRWTANNIRGNAQKYQGKCPKISGEI